MYDTDIPTESDISIIIVRYASSLYIAWLFAWMERFWLTYMYMPGLDAESRLRSLTSSSHEDHVTD